MADLISAAAVKRALKERPILFSAPMICAILDGRKTQTRRVVRWPVLGPSIRGKRRVYTAADLDREREAIMARCPYGKPGDVLRVRETWATCERADGVDGITFFADGGAFVPIEPTPAAADLWVQAHDNGKHEGKWRPSIFLPTWASRIKLDVVGVSIELLQAITEDDARAEGVTLDPIAGRVNGEPATLYPMTHTQAFIWLWDSINGKRPGCAWADNPLVWRVAFRRVE